MFIHLITEGVHATIARQVPCAKADPPHIIANAMFARPVLDTIKVYSVPLPTDNAARGEVPMPNYEEVTQRAGSLRALTGLTEAEFQA
jgi:hypothetical protein